MNLLLRILFKNKTLDRKFRKENIDVFGSVIYWSRVCSQNFLLISISAYNQTLVKNHEDYLRYV